MATTQKHRLFEKVPSVREYEDQSDAELDDALVNAIEKAENADNDYLATVLENELGSHYYSNKK
ncbi:hypothetical protein ACT4ML_19850 [Natrinema sp. LN54]|uniref:hypothetical protein n=1 Tax=Natrinema sp. LN54 TaxID=3458705 RepID=UPI0040359292